ncbi:helix-turn-helix domain-containing protein [Tunicatimonas pelagia]|uniref:helix-turn-helix domain-containing protein n=1 Tax=Tunicatimonas pelagia TaxID=931531 RepID=UPI0026668C5F|nr:helix-turn-helix domain-containing protein [Tunicatimonas pelagia]WKN44891.1 helix-turn-helix domain-containing protein [Tunicatimonas pelagia]
MATTIITPDDLAQLKRELLEEFRALLAETHPPPKPWLKSSEVQQLLQVSASTLQTLRLNGTLPFSKLGGAIYYAYQDIERILSENKSDHLANDEHHEAT